MDVNSTPSKPRSVIPILGDQLSHDLPVLLEADPACDLIVMAEVMEEASYVPHHKKKIAFVFSAMRHFAKELEEKGWRVRYSRLDDPENTGTLFGEIERALKAYGANQVKMVEPGEFRLLTSLQSWSDQTQSALEMWEDTRFIATRKEFANWASGRKQLRMEYFYREMRRKTGLLMAGTQPEGGRWNFDSENRKPAKNDLFMPRPLRHEPDEITQDVLKLVARRFERNFGDLHPFGFAVTREDALAALEHFVTTTLPNFGDYQDAMLEGEEFLYHSLLAQNINVGLLNPLEVCKRVERAYYDEHAPLNAVEGFIRQIIGWREYVRGIYWLKMPGYTNENFFEAERPLPLFYWTAETDMACIASAISQTKKLAYAHHIQRLMVTGNFAMLAGINPTEVHEWYLAVYADAYEWVEAPNTIGMSQFADGGFLGSKPYAASGNYINKMSNYCSGCRYDVKQKTGPEACPFNALYWDFLVRNRSKLDGNPRLGQVYRTWDKMAEDKQQEYLASASDFLAKLQ